MRPIDKDSVLRQLFEASYRPLCLFAQSYVVDGGTAADIVQDGFAALWERWGEYPDDARRRTFLYVTVRNRCLNHLRDNRKRHEELPQIGSDDFFHSNIIQQEAMRVLREAIEQLSPQARRVISLSLEGLGNAEIAARMGIAESSVHSTKKIAYRKLRSSLKDYYYLLFFLLNLD